MKTHFCSVCSIPMELVQVVRGGRDEIDFFKCPNCGKEVSILRLANPAADLAKLFAAMKNDCKPIRNMTATRRQYWCRHCRKMSILSLPVSFEDQKCSNSNCGQPLSPPYQPEDFGIRCGEDRIPNWLGVHRQRNYGVPIKWKGL